MESVEVINKRLLEYFGKFEDGRPNWRVVWSNDQFEKKIVTETPEGLQLIGSEVREVPKYYYSRNRFILEKLIPVPEIYTDLTTKTSYEPVFTFQDSNGEALPPDWDIIYLIVTRVYDNIINAGRKGPYKAPYGSGNTIEEQKMRAEKIYEELFGNESAITDALSLDSAVGYGTRTRKDWMN